MAHLSENQNRSGMNINPNWKEFRKPAAPICLLDCALTFIHPGFEQVEQLMTLQFPHTGGVFGDFSFCYTFYRLHRHLTDRSLASKRRITTFPSLRQPLIFTKVNRSLLTGCQTGGLRQNQNCHRAPAFLGKNCQLRLLQKSHVFSR